MMVERPVAPQSSPLTTTLAQPAGSPLELVPALASVPAPTPTANPATAPTAPISRWQATHDLACLRAETDRVKVLVDFLARPICAHGGTDPDPDIVTAYNLAVEAALHGIRRAAQGMAG